MLSVSDLRSLAPEGVPVLIAGISGVAIIGGLTTLASATLNEFLPREAWHLPLALTPLAATLFVLVGSSLWAFLSRTSGRWRVVVVRTLSLAVVMVSMVALAEDIFRDHSAATPASTRAKIGPGAQDGLEPATAAAFVMLGSAIFWLPAVGRSPRLVAQCLLLGTMFIASIAAARSWYGTETEFTIDPYTSIPWVTAVGLILACIGVLYSRRDFELMTPLRSERMGGVLVRTSLPGVAASPLMLGWFFLKGEQLELYGFESAVAVHAVAMVAVLSRIMWYGATKLNEVDRQRELARQQEQDWRVLSALDPLTGLLNRRSLEDRLEREWNRAQRSHQPLSCIMVDVDHFKRINDSYGHMVGDTVLKMVATILTQHCRPADVVARFGGEEFCIIAPEATEFGAVNLAERLRRALHDCRISIPEANISVSASFGVAECRDSRDAFDSLVERADQALMRAKRGGRNRVVGATRGEPHTGHFSAWLEETPMA